MEEIREIIIPVATLLIGFLGRNLWNILGYARTRQKDELEIGEKLMKAINEARDDVVNAYALLNQLETENFELKNMNRKLESEIQEKDSLITRLRADLEDASKKLEAAVLQVQNLFKSTGLPEYPNEMPNLNSPFNPNPNPKI